MYQGKILKEIYQINEEKFILQYTDNTKEFMSFDSFYITVGYRKYSINTLFHNMENRIPIELQDAKFFSYGFENLSRKKMQVYYTLNEYGFKKTSYKYVLKDQQDYFGISFNIKSEHQHFKVILIFNNNNVRFVPIIFVNKPINIDTINMSKTYKYLKQHFSIKYHNKNNEKSDEFSKMIKYSDYLHQNSLHFFYLVE